MPFISFYFRNVKKKFLYLNTKFTNMIAMKYREKYFLEYTTFRGLTKNNRSRNSLANGNRGLIN